MPAAGGVSAAGQSILQNVSCATICRTFAALWDGPLVGYENTLMVHIRRLREKIEADPSHPKYLLTVRGLGYRLSREGTK